MGKNKRKRSHTKHVFVQKKYRDALFRRIFNEKPVLLELYNALNQTDYDDADELIFYTIDDVIYLGYKNDVSFIVRGTLNLYEHQSTLNPNMPIRGLSENGGVVFCGVDSTELVRRAEQLHTTSATCSAALGRLLTGASLMGSMLKDDGDKVTLRVQGGGPAGVLIACTDGTGNVKGCIDNPLVELPPKADGHLDVGGAVGRSGVLTVIRDNRLQKEPTVGQVPLVSGEIAEDLTRYYATSEQIPTVCALGVLVDKDLSILCAGGYLLQLLPGATDAEIDTLEKNIAAMPSVTEMLRAGKTPKDMMELAMAGFAPQVLDERTVGYQCDCSEERTKGMLLSLGRRELVKMRDEDPHCEVVCHFCHSRYQYDLNDLIAEYDAQAAQRAAEEAAQNTNA